MINERAFIRQVETANASEFAEILRSVDRDQERALRIHLGDASFERMRDAALRVSLKRDAGAFKAGNVVVLHGIMGSELSEGATKIWLNFLRLAVGEFSHLATDAAGNSVRDVAATGILKKYYGDLLLRLANDNWDVQHFSFDWRMDIRRSADALAASIAKWFPDRPVHLIAHSMGGLVARCAIQRHPEMWRAMAPGRLIMMGTPNHGSFAIPLLFGGLNSSIKSVAALDIAHNQDDLLQIAKGFRGAWHMLPSLLKDPAVLPLYAAQRYGNVQPPQQAIDDARQFHTEIQAVSDKERMLYIAGYNQLTADGILNYDALTDMHSYHTTKRGDGTVPHSLGLLDGVTTFYVDEEHSKLPGNAKVLEAIDSLLTTGTVAEPILWHGLRADIRGLTAEPDQSQAAAEALAHLEANRAEAAALAATLRARGAATGAAQIVTPEERRLSDLVFRGMSLDSRADADTGTSLAPDAQKAGVAPPAATGSIRVHVMVKEIEKVVTGDTPEPGTPAVNGKHEVPIDAIAVGHYIGVKPQFAELALDKALSEAMQSKELVLTEFTERGLIRGELGQPFLMDDPRDHGGGARRVIAIAGMGVVGRFGTAELTVLAGELCWALSKLGKRHLATVLIGAGAGNLSVEDAIAGWMQGVQRAAAQGSQDVEQALQEITFVERYEKQANLIWLALAMAAKALAEQGFTVELCDPPATINDSRPQQTHEPAPTRITAELRDNSFRFGAITESASIPERDVPVNPKLVFEVNDLIAAEQDPARLLQRGEFLRRLLFPRDLENLLSGSAPIVLACDSNVAQIHWELMRQPNPGGAFGDGAASFLGLCRGFTRQLRTAFAPQPEPTPPAKRNLRVLVVADTASDMPLPGAREEGLAVCQLMNNAVNRRGADTVEVTSMIGPNEANWALVMEKLLDNPPFDVLHYAGHCYYNQANPESSGWVFSGGNVLTARELARVDRVPRFVFSNACESGITPSRPDLRSAGLAPSFAETFFGRGVTNFICTAWPVDDAAARTFALRVYSGMLGAEVAAEPIYVAMREARRMVMQMAGWHSWGAYQHYGNPYFRLFR